MDKRSSEKLSVVRRMTAAWVASSGGAYHLFSDANIHTKLFSDGLLPSRLQRPAAWATLPKPASARITSGKSTSTLASMREVVITRQGSPFFKRLSDVVELLTAVFGTH